MVTNLSLQQRDMKHWVKLGLILAATCMLLSLFAELSYKVTLDLALYSF